MRIRRRSVFIVWSTLVLLALGALVVDKELLLARGETVYLELQPRDPRSLIQGDYMALRVELANEIAGHRGDGDTNGRVVVRLDERQVGEFERIYQGGELEPGEQLIRWKRRDGISVGSNAFYFQEGQAEVYENAAYAELRVDPSGEALLVGLRDDQLRFLGKPTHTPAQTPRATSNRGNASK